MAHSPGSAERRANLIREMSRQGDRPRSGASVGSSDGSVHGQLPAYDTESQQLPPLRPEHDFQINTSALRRAFPDFSQYGTSDGDSIEMGRGYRKSAKSTPSKGLPSEDVSENIPFTFGNAGNYRITGTPPIRPRSANIKASTAQTNNELRDASSKAPLASTENKENEDEARVLGDLHARVDSDESGSVGLGRPALVNMSTRNTRFANRRGKASANTEPAGPNGTNTSGISGVNGTYQSFVLPDMPNITELISGVRQDGTPLFTRSAKSRSRFATPSQGRRTKQSHVPVNSAPIPPDEKALYVSLQLLHEKVSTLETEKAQTEKKLDEYELEVLQLKSKLEEREQARNSDSGIGTDPEDAKSKHVGMEKSKLELSIKTLQDRLERTNRKATKADVTIQNLTKDRDAAHQQLAIAYLNSEELRNESQAMRDELESIRAQVAQLNRDHERNIERLTKQETELRGKIERREKAINEMSSLAKELWQTRNALVSISEPSRISKSHQSQSTDHIKLQKTRRSSQGAEQKPSQLAAGQTYGDSHPRTTSKSRATTGDTIRRHRVSSIQRAVVYDSEDEIASHAESTTNINLRRPYSAHELTKNSTYMSFMEGDEVSKLRRVLEDDKQKLAISRGEQPEPPTGRLLPRKSSMKKVKHDDAGRIVRDDQPLDEMAKNSRGQSYETQYTQQSLASVGSERHRRSGIMEQTEMTSAFILPDITLSGAAMNGQFRAGQLKNTMSVPRPTPVSDRMPVASEGEPDVTLRPVKSPAVALATVLKTLEDELAQLRAQLVQQETLYHKHDPALSKRKRKIVYARMQKLLAAIEIRADQIYALYDVLEGQKTKGQTMQEEEVEVTLQNIGIDPEVLRAATSQSTKVRPTVQMDGAADGDDSARESEDEDDASEELPWEGFEPTQTQTLDNIGRFGGR